MTKNKKLIYDIIKRSDLHLTAGDIFFEAKKIQPHISVGTVYRNLGLLTHERLISKIQIPNAADVYDKSNIKHEHLICEICGEVIDVCNLGLKEFIEERIKIKINNYELSIKYICDKCKEK